MTPRTFSVEYAPFKTRPGVAESDLLAASEALQADLEKLPDFLGRILLRQEEGSYVDLVFWKKRMDSAQMGKFIEESPGCALYFQKMIMDPQVDPEAAVTHFEPVRSYGRVAIG